MHETARPKEDRPEQDTQTMQNLSYSN